MQCHLIGSIASTTRLVVSKRRKVFQNLLAALPIALNTDQLAGHTSSSLAVLRTVTQIRYFDRLFNNNIAFLRT